MIASTANVATERPALYLKRLCEHFADASRRHSGQEFDVAFDDDEGFIDFAPVISGTCRLVAREGGVLALDAIGTDQAALERVQRIVAKHLARFGERDGLDVDWGPASEQRSGSRLGLP
jgi:hypothetical protein